MRCSTPRRGPGRAGEDRGVVDESPVGADDAVEAVALPQESGDDRLVEAEADLFVLGADGHAVVRHDLARAGLEGGLERLQVRLELAAGVDLLATVREVRVLAVLLGAAAREVLRHGRDGVGAELGALEAADVGGAHATGELGVFTEGLQRARPAGLGGEVDLRVQRHADADRRVLLAGDVAELLDERLVADGCEAHGLGPHRERAGEHARERVVGIRVTRIGRDRHGDAEAGRGRSLLQAVVPLGDELRRGRGLQHIEVVHETARDVVVGRRQPEHVVALRERAVFTGGDHRLEEEPGLLFERHLREEDLDALGDGQVRVAVSQVESAGGVDGRRGIRLVVQLIGHAGTPSCFGNGPRCGIRFIINRMSLGFRVLGGNAQARPHARMRPCLVGVAGERPTGRSTDQSEPAST